MSKFLTLEEARKQESWLIKTEKRYWWYNFKLLRLLNGYEQKKETI